jgi:hypothetical protein
MARAEKAPAPTLARDIEQASVLLESQIKAVAEAGKAIERSAIKKSALMRLIAHESGVAMTDVRTILDVLPDLDKRLLKP